MIHKTINLNEDGSVYLKTYIHEEYEPFWENEIPWQPKLRPAIIFLPGGAFRKCTPKAGDPMAVNFLTAGFDVFTLYYSLGDSALFPQVLDDACKAIWTVRKNADEWHIDPDKIAMGGFSAGGSITSMLGTLWNTPGLCERLGIPVGQNNPNALILGYAPTVHDDEVAKAGNTRLVPGAILHQNPPELNTYKLVGSQTPPTFIWHTYEDEKVPCVNALKFANACLDNKVPFELHLFQHGKHGLNTATDLSAYGQEIPTNTGYWIPLCINWLRDLFKF